MQFFNILFNKITFHSGLSVCSWDLTWLAHLDSTCDFGFGLDLKLGLWDLTWDLMLGNCKQLWPYAVGKQQSIPLINLGRKWTLKWWRWWEADSDYWDKYLCSWNSSWLWTMILQLKYHDFEKDEGSGLTLNGSATYHLNNFTTIPFYARFS